MFAPMEGKRSASVVFVAGAACVALAVAGCGAARQDANEPSGTYHVSVLASHFPAKQTVAAPATLKLSVRNDDSKTIPNVSITVRTSGGATTGGSKGAAANGFNYLSTQPGLSNPQRPVWIIDGVAAFVGAPQTLNLSGGATTYNSTWSAGPLAPGKTATFSWRLTPIKPGSWTIGYRVDAGLNGKAIAALANGRPPTGSLRARIGDVPPQSRVDPNTGRVIRSAPAIAPGTPAQAAGEGQ